jgi:hypothetical protein
VTPNYVPLSSLPHPTPDRISGEGEGSTGPGADTDTGIEGFRCEEGSSRSRSSRISTSEKGARVLHAVFRAVPRSPCLYLCPHPARFTLDLMHFILLLSPDVFQVAVSSASSFFSSSSSPSSSPVKTPAAKDQMEVVVVDGSAEKLAAPAPSKRVLPFRSPAPVPLTSSSVSRTKSPARNVKKKDEEDEDKEEVKEKEDVKKSAFVPKKWHGGGGGGQERGGAALGALSASELPNGAKNCLEVSEPCHHITPLLITSLHITSQHNLPHCMPWQW